MARPRLVVYTVLTGTKEPLGNPLAALPPGATSDLDLQFVCFSDDPQLRSPVWDVRPIGAALLPPEKLSRRPKALAHEYLPDAEYSLYVDNIVVFKRLPQQADLATDAEYLFKVYRHATRRNPQEEAEAIVQIGYESAERIGAQIDHYRRHGPLSDIAPLSTCTVILRQHRHPAVAAAGTAWWEQILNFGKRDQMSFDFAVRMSGARLQHLPGLKHDNDLIHNTANAQGQRVLANFDAVRYAWIHRDDAEARADPRRHWLQRRCDNQGGDVEAGPRAYAIRSQWFEFLCHRQGSSLGAQVAPRRQLATALQDLLAPRRDAGGRLLIVRVQHDGDTAYTRDEAERAESALCTFLPAHGGTRIDLASAQLAAGRLAFKAGDGPFDLVLVVGMPAALLAQTQALVAAALAPAAGLLCVLAAEPVPVAAVAEAEAGLATRLGKPCRASLAGGRHDSRDGWLPNVLLAFEWGDGV